MKTKNLEEIVTELRRQWEDIGCWIRKAVDSLAAVKEGKKVKTTDWDEWRKRGKKKVHSPTQSLLFKKKAVGKPA